MTRLTTSLRALGGVGLIAAIVGSGVVAYQALPVAEGVGATDGLSQIFLEAQHGSELDGAYEQAFMQQGSEWTLEASMGRHGFMTIGAQAAAGGASAWSLVIGGPSQTLITVGEHVAVSSDTGSGRATLQIRGPHTVCGDSAVGQMTVYQVEMASATVVSRFAASFEMHCSGQVAAITGEVHFHSTNAPSTAMVLEAETMAYAQVGTSHTLSVHNYGSVAQNVTAELRGAFPEFYRITSDPCGSIAPSASCSVVVEYLGPASSLVNHPAELVFFDQTRRGEHRVALYRGDS